MQEQQPPREVRSICDKCLVNILKAAQGIVHAPIEVGNSVDTEVEFMDDRTGHKFKLYMKLTNEGSIPSESM